MHSLLSIHDVSPASLGRVKAIIERLAAPCLKDLVLLVIPGHTWRQQELSQLLRWQERGFILAGHGWFHQCERYGGWYHRLHSLLISRKAAEHLMLSEEEIAGLLERSHRWFSQNGFQSPDYYVPPAWAMGRVRVPVLRESPYRYFETTSGILDTDSGQLRKLPLVGFEADNSFRALSLSAWNRINMLLESPGRPLRISIHPYDPELRLGGDLWRLLGSVTRCRHYSSVFS